MTVWTVPSNQPDPLAVTFVVVMVVGFSLCLIKFWLLHRESSELDQRATKAMTETRALLLRIGEVRPHAYCPKCSTAVPDVCNYCARCGSPVRSKFVVKNGVRVRRVAADR